MDDLTTVNFDELTDNELRELVNEHLNFSEDNDAIWRKLTSVALVGRTRGALVDMIEDVDAQIAIRREEDPQWAKKAIWFRSLLRRRMARVNTATKQGNVAGMLQAQEWQSIALHLAQAIARHEADLCDDPEGPDPSDAGLWAILDSETRRDGSTIRHWLLNIVPPEKYRDAS